MCPPWTRMRGGRPAAIAAGQRALERRLGKTFVCLVRQYIRLELMRLARRRRQIFSLSNLEPENFDRSSSAAADDSESDVEAIVPLQVHRTEKQKRRDESENTRRTGFTPRASAAKKPKGDTRQRDERRIIKNDGRTVKRTKGKSNSKEIIRTTESHTSNPDNNFEEPNESEQRSGEAVFTDGRQATSTADYLDTSLRTVVVRLERQDLRLELMRFRRQRRLTITGTPENFGLSNRQPEHFVRSSPADSDSDVEEIIPLEVYQPDIQKEQDESETQRTKKRRAELTPKSPAVSPILDVDIEPEDEHPSNGLSNVRVTVMMDYHKQDLEPKNLDKTSPPAADDSDVEEVILLQPEIQKEQDVSETQRTKKRKTALTPRASAADKLKCDSRQRDERRIEQNDSIRGDQTKKRKSNSRIIRTTQNRTSKLDINFKQSYKRFQQSVSAEKTKKQYTRPKTGREVKCDVCERSFNRKGLLINHRRIHTGEKPFKCRVCKRSFTEKGGLTTHNLVHTGEKPLKCEVCDRRFRFQNALRRHYRAHANLRPFTCDICDRSFSEKGNLVKHFRKHTGEKPFMCRVCKHRFTEKGNLTKHMAKAHQNNARKNKCSIQTMRAQKENRPNSH